MIVHKSKIGYEIFIPVVILLGATFYLHIANLIWAGIIVNTLIVIFLIYLYKEIKYIISGNQLVIKAGFLMTTTIPIASIRCINRTNNPFSAAALSLDRIEILYGNRKRVIISPKDRSIFVNELLKRNPDIKYFESI